MNDGFGKIMNDITKTINHVGKNIKDFILALPLNSVFCYFETTPL